jgi:aryl-alcohol dehydrogenase-like predicted oxidoreductase
MRITGPGIWGWPADVEGAKALLRRAVDLGIDLIDTADAYGPEVSEYLLAAALRPYPSHLVIATKGGLVRGGPRDWEPDGRPEHLTRAVENSLRRLETDCIDLYQLHTVDPDVPIEDSVGALADLQRAGKIRHIGVCNVRVDALARARAIADIATVQNRYSIADRAHEPVLDACTAEGIGFLPWFPLGAGRLVDDGRLRAVADRHGATPGQIALSWLLGRSPVVMPIPGTSSIEHLEENVRAEAIALTTDDLDALSAIAPPVSSAASSPPRAHR